MLVKANTLIASVDALRNINSLDLQLSVALLLARYSKQLEAVMEEFQKRETALLEEYGDPVEGAPGQFNVRKDDIEAFNEKMTALREEEVEVDIQQINTGMLEGSNVKAQDLMQLDWFFSDFQG